MYGISPSIYRLPSLSACANFGLFNIANNSCLLFTWQVPSPLADLTIFANAAGNPSFNNSSKKLTASVKLWIDLPFGTARSCS